METLIIIITMCVLYGVAYFHANRKKKSENYSKYLNNYQVSVYDRNHNMTYCSIFEAFTAEEAIEKCRDYLTKENKIPKYKPVKFFTINKNHEKYIKQ